jgi:hypothetical protein
MSESSSNGSASNLSDISLVGGLAMFRESSGYLKAELFLQNSGSKGVFIQDIRLVFEQGQGSPCFPDKMTVNQFIEPGCPQKIRCRLRLPSIITAGQYYGQLAIGEQNYKAQIEIYPKIRLSISPDSVQYQGISKEKKYDTVIQLKNDGNVPYTIGKLNHSMMLDYDYICKASALSIGAKDPIGLMGLLDNMVKNIQSKYSKLLTVSLREVGKVLQPGDEIPLHISFTLPENIENDASYTGNIRIAADAILSYQFFA